jgi:asparagine synthase (glutamine-hydrolysing)
MCGVAGFFVGSGALGTDDSLQRLQRMGDAIAHRGPDGDGYWHDPVHGVGFAHRRLAIVDLTPTGAQPMASASGRYMLVYNGEIYNHLQLRHRLSADWRGTSDTETLLAGFDRWGVRATVEAAVGMFAFAVWDHAERSLTLARDRLGEKPLYYGWQGGAGTGAARTFLFASDLAALKAHPAFAAEVSRDAIRTLMRFNNVGGSASIYVGVSKLPPGSLLTLSERDPDPRPVRYWSGADVALRGTRAPFTGGPAAATDALEALLREAVGQQMMADVPLGAFLSGGVDSTMVAALMQAQSSRPVRTFSIGFREDSFNEAHHALAVARHLGTEHTELYVTAQDALDLIPALPSIYSEPFADSSQIATFLLSRLTRGHVTVALSGDGGDELFCGYNRYQITQKLWRRLSLAPPPLRRWAAGLLLRVPPASWDRIAQRLARTFAAAARWSHFGGKLHKGARVMASANVRSLYLGLVSQWPDPAEVAIGGVEPSPLPEDAMAQLDGLGDVEQMMALDMLGYMNDDVLTKVDRAAMGASLEGRVPMLDHRVVEFAWQLPLSYKLRDDQTKWILRQVLYRHVPRALIERPKSGFAVPIGTWLRGPLRAWAEELLDESRLRREGFLNPAPVRAKWAQHLAGHQDWDSQLWTVLMFQAWLTQAAPKNLRTVS